MTPKQRLTPRRRALVAKVHIAAKACGQSDADYRDFLQTHGGGRSASGMTDEALERVVSAYKRHGWVESPRTETARRRRDSATPQVRMIYGLWKSCAESGAVENSGKTALRSFCRSQGGADAPEWLAPAGRVKVIEALKAMELRAKAKTAKPKSRNGARYGK